MNKDIKTMLELQSFWSDVLKSSAAAERCKEDILLRRNELREREAEYSELTQTAAKRRKTIKEKEFLLNELDQKIKKLEDRKNLLKTQRETDAVQSELDALKKEDGDLESELISLIDILAQEDERLRAMLQEIESQRAVTGKAIEELEAGIKLNEETAARNRESYDSLLGVLDGAYRPRFDKLLKAKNGKAVGEVTNEICGVCNFKIPSYLASDAVHESNVVICTNCGSYIYRLE
ncbi:MAG: hypothetical protein LBT84_06050 [Spirochaetia bacterium]|nr:hypothetical protein [Spirochaetia bacterium]